MLTKDSLIAGLLLGVIFPGIAFAAAYLLRDNIFIINKPALPFLVAIALNLVATRFFAKRDLVKLVKGIVITTFAVMLLLFIFILHPIR
jgi:hypothetical protein